MIIGKVDQNEYLEEPMRLCWPVRDFSDRTTIEAPYFKRNTLCRILTPKEETSNRVKCIPMTETLRYWALDIHDTVFMTQ